MNDYISLSHIGSFQNERTLIYSEDPLNEVWSHIARFGTSFLEKRLKPYKKDIPWNEYLKYAQVRTRQALEFRHAARDASLLTAPLPLYYSFLNLTRAFLALGPEVMPKTGHGLKFVIGDDLLSSHAQLCSGTFTDYLDTQNVAWNERTQISLSDALGNIVELAYDYRLFDKTHLHIQTISVRAIMDGPVRLQLLNYPDDFATTWKAGLPELADVCVAEGQGLLLVTDENLGKSYDAIAEFLDKRLLPGLALQNHATWYALRRKDGVIRLTRAAYYYVAMFVLGSAVRYEPELLLSASAADSEIGWLLQRFLRLAERYFPQLKLMEHYRSQIYFSGSSGM
ncbi:MAG: Uncharacterized protein FD134_2226 [Gallionellaceae bacterium]|nr:MAG: Uncharacterized protein FD134_2226 [Gallionellaceae bacterium]